MHQIVFAVLADACRAVVSSTTVVAEQFHDHAENPNPVLPERGAPPTARASRPGPSGRPSGSPNRGAVKR